MRVLVAGSRGYIGTVLVPAFRRAGHEVSAWTLVSYEGCDLGAGPEPFTGRRTDIRDVTAGRPGGASTRWSTSPRSRTTRWVTSTRRRRTPSTLDGAAHVARAARAAGVAAVRLLLVVQPLRRRRRRRGHRGRARSTR